MNAAVSDFVKWFLEFIKSKAAIKVFIVVFLISAFALSLPMVWLERIGMSFWVVRLWPWLVGTCVFSGLWLGVSLIDHFGRPVVRRLVARHRIRAYLDTLSIDEFCILAKYAEADRKTLYFHPADGAVQNLVNAGVLYWSSNLAGRTRGRACTVEPLAWLYLHGPAFRQLSERLIGRDLEARRKLMDERSRPQ